MKPSARHQRRKAPRQRPEEVIQRHCVGVLRAYVPPPPEGPFWTAINPVAAKSKAVAGVSKAMGMKAGVLDLILIQRDQRPAFVEFKAPRGSLSADQRARINEIEDAGGKVYICRSVDEFLGILQAEGVPCRISNYGRTIGNVHNTRVHK